MTIALAPVAALVLLLAGCASGGASPSPHPTTATAKAYGTVQGLADAFHDAGAKCTFKQDNQVTVAAESGDCGTDTVLMTFTGESDRDTAVSNLKSLGEMMDVNLLVGPNWILNSPDSATYKDSLGGTVVTVSADK